MDKNGNGELKLAPALQQIREALRKPNGNELPGMRNDWNGLREFLLGGIRPDGMWPAGTISVSCRDKELQAVLHIFPLEIEARYSGQEWDAMWQQIDADLQAGSVPWQLDYKGRQRLERSMLA